MLERNAAAASFQGLRGAVDAALGGRTEHLAAADLGARAKPEPGSEVLDSGEAAHVGTDLADHRHCGGHVDTVDAGEIDAADLEQMLAYVELGRIASAAAALASRRGAGMLVQQRHGALDLGVALGELRAAEVECGQRLLEREQVLVAPVAQQAGCDLVLQVFAEPKVSQRASASPRGGVRRKPKAKSRDDEQKPDMRRSAFGASGHVTTKPSISKRDACCKSGVYARKDSCLTTGDLCGAVRQK